MTTDEKIDQILEKILLIEKDIQFLKFKIDPIPKAKEKFLIEIEMGGLYKSRSGKKVLILEHDETDNSFLGRLENGLPCWFNHDGKIISDSIDGDLIEELATLTFNK